jgi:hypothetical protein
VQSKRSVNRRAHESGLGHTGVMSSSPRVLRRRAVAAVLAGVLVLAACGGADSSDDSADAASSGTQAPAPPDEADVDPTADNPANQLPDVVVDDLQLGNKVNLRNFAPSDTPILLWMWAPH